MIGAMTNRLFCATLAALLASCAQAPAPSPAAPSAAESGLQTAKAAPEAVVPDKSMSLFNGKDLSGWKPDVPEKEKNPAAPDSFIVRNGMLVSLGTPLGHLTTTAAYRD